MTQERIGGWIETSGGRQVWPLDPLPEEIDGDDIAHALSNICRYNGHCRHHYSVAQHSVLCAEYARRMGHNHLVQLYCLLHDASEAYLCDIPSPIKPHLTNYELAECRMMETIYQHYGMALPPSKLETIIKDIDIILRNIEAVELLPRATWAHKVERRGIEIVEMTPFKAETLFASRLTDLLFWTSGTRGGAV